MDFPAELDGEEDKSYEWAHPAGDPIIIEPQMVQAIFQVRGTNAEEIHGQPAREFNHSFHRSVPSLVGLKSTGCLTNRSTVDIPIPPFFNTSSTIVQLIVHPSLAISIELLVWTTHSARANTRLKSSTALIMRCVICII